MCFRKLRIYDMDAVMKNTELPVLSHDQFLVHSVFLKYEKIPNYYTYIDNKYNIYIYIYIYIYIVFGIFLGFFYYYYYYYYIK